ncbi:MAG: type IV pilus modification protein PilV [Gammaproteobacteria bacterium]|nr:type IV pilus modification protein PilV [Gammaproteobacteria bacterium]
MIHHPKINAYRKNKGFTLIEVMISVLIFSMGLLGIAALQATSIKNNNNAYLRTQANIITYSIVDAMRANRVVAIAGDYNIDMATPVPTTSGTIAKDDQVTWFGDLTALPGGDGSINCTPAGVCNITVQWNENINTINTVEFSLSTQI